MRNLHLDADCFSNLGVVLLPGFSCYGPAEPGGADERMADNLCAEVMAERVMKLHCQGIKVFYLFGICSSGIAWRTGVRQCFVDPAIDITFLDSQ